MRVKKMSDDYDEIRKILAMEKIKQREFLPILLEGNKILSVLFLDIYSLKDIPEREVSWRAFLERHTSPSPQSIERNVRELSICGAFELRGSGRDKKIVFNSFDFGDKNIESAKKTLSYKSMRE
jgi:hypothetical protein